MRGWKVVLSPRTDLETKVTGSPENNLLEVICVDMGFCDVERAARGISEVLQILPEFHRSSTERGRLLKTHSRLKLVLATCTFAPVKRISRKTWFMLILLF
ncbi:unnamed protein product [Cuscuta europaea]|uniref:Uncharacterized protein n=1 Tax=Cuscuta europaea TaxID=41803 RepID=A0A9P0Z909_CUSEU|nr:unnamed protein product [Cuscuta europaea]